MKRLYHHEEQAIRDLIVGHAVKKVSDDLLALDNGTVIRVVPNDGGCSCGAGDYELIQLRESQNVITRLDILDEYLDPMYPGYDEGPRRYSIYVLAEDKRFSLATIEGDDGNGYYGTGFALEVELVTDNL